MLEALDGVDWPRLHHAYGPAGDVPHLLRQLRSSDGAQRLEAVDALYSNIWHQGTVYEATAAAVPFLFELLGDDATPGRQSIAILLGLIARGRSYHEVHAPQKAQEVARERAWVSAAREAVRHGVAIAVRLLDESDQEIRLAAVHLLASIDDVAGQSRRALEAALASESAPAARACLGLALAAHGKYAPEAFEVHGATGLPMLRLGRLAGDAAAHVRVVDDALEILLDLATDAFEAERLDELDAPDASSVRGPAQASRSGRRMLVGGAVLLVLAGALYWLLVRA